MGQPAEPVAQSSVFNPNDLLGETFKLKETPGFHSSYWELDDPKAKKLIEDHPHVRFYVPGVAYPMEYRFGRINLHLDNEGTVVKITNG